MKPIIAFLLLCLSVFVVAQNENDNEKKTKPQWLEAKGYIKSLQYLSFIDDIEELSSSNLLHNRLNFKFTISNTLSARLEIRNRIFYGDQTKLMPNFGEIINQYNGLVNLSKLWVNKPSIVCHSVIDRLLLQYATNTWDIKLGRQRINWGINNVWNPNDIFNAYNFLDFDYEERPGNDALRVQHYFKDNSSAELAYKPGKNTNEHIAALLYKFNKKNYDFQTLMGIYNTDVVVGGGWAGNIKNAGFKGEISYFHPQKNITDTIGTLSLSLMADQTFKNNWYLSIGGLYNSRPSNNLGGNMGIASTNLSAKSLFPFRYTFYAGISKSVSPIAAINFSTIYSPKNNTLILFPSFSWNVAKNFDIDFTAQSFFAQSLHNYNTQGNTFFMRGKWSF